MNNSQAINHVAPRFEIPMTAVTHRDLSAELARLHAAGDDEPITTARIARLEDILTRAVVVEPSRSGEVVAIGSAVTLRDRSSGSTRAYLVDGAHGSLEPDVISALSPMGEALLGQRAGARVAVDLPDGRVRDFELLSVTQGAPT